jgi:hypothetical protein
MQLWVVDQAFRAGLQPAEGEAIETWGVAPG